jgi:hypothetical protein
MLSFRMKIKTTSVQTGVVTSWITTTTISKILDIEMSYCMKYHKDILMIELIATNK